MSSSDSEVEDFPPLPKNKDLRISNDNITFSNVKGCCATGHILNEQGGFLIKNLNKNILSFSDLEPKCFMNLLALSADSLNSTDKNNIEIVGLINDLRHDFFGLNVIKQIGLDVSIYDKPFKDLNLNIETKKRPDYILIQNENVTLIEFAVTGASDFADSKKGTPDDSKYFSEIENLEILGYKVFYKPIILRLDKAYNDNRNEWLSLGFSIEMEEYHQLLRDFNSEFTKNFKHLICYRDNDFREKFIDFESKFVYKRDKVFAYKTNDRNTIIKNYKDRIKLLISNTSGTSDGKRYVLNYNLHTASMNLEEDNKGFDIETISDILSRDFIPEELLKVLQIRSKNFTEGEEFEIMEIKDTLMETDFNFVEHNGSFNVTPENFNEWIKIYLSEHDIPFSVEPIIMENEQSAKCTIPSLYNFDEVLSDSIKLIENNNIDNDKLFYKSVNNDKVRAETCLKFNEVLENINSLDSESKRFKAKTSFTNFIKPNEDHNELDRVSLIRELQKVVSTQTHSLLQLFDKPEMAFEEVTVATALSECDPTFQKYRELTESLNEAKSAWRDSKNYLAVKRNVMKLKDDNEPEALSYKAASLKLRKYQEVQGKIKRALGVEMTSMRMPATKEISAFIKKEVSRDHNINYFEGTGHFRHTNEKWVKDQLFRDVNSLCNSLFSETSFNNNFTIHYDGWKEEIKVTDTLKKRNIGEINDFQNKLRKTALGETLEFNSNLFKSLIFLSSVPMKGRMVALDTIKRGDTLLFVKGGKSMRDTTRQFKVITKILPESAPFYTCFNDPSTSFQIHMINGKHYLETPWMMYQAGLAEHHHLLSYKISSFIVSMTEEIQDEGYELPRYSVPILAAFNARRTTEEMLHGFRQMFMNFRAEYSKVDDLVAKSFDSSRDYVQYFIQKYILGVLEGFKENIKVYKDPLTQITSQDVEVWTIYMYCSRLLPKAAVGTSSELRNDIKDFLKTYTDCTIKTETRLSDYETELGDDPFKHDLQFSPKLSWLAGVYVSDYLKQHKMIPAICKDFQNLYSKNIYNTTKNTGCRLDPVDQDIIRGKSLDEYLTMSEEEMNKLILKGKKIYGMKGVEAYYVEFKKEDMNYDEIIRYIEAPGPITANAMIGKNNTSLLKNMKECIIKSNDEVGVRLNKTMRFSIHAKVQWGGSREIFACTVNTKCLQQLAEGVFKILCKRMPNEMISVPSNKRNVWLHTNVHQRCHKGTNIMSYDYRRWGPHCNFKKYKYFVLGMADVLPKSFVEFFMAMVESMENKEVLIKREDFLAVYNHAEIKPIINSYKENITFYPGYVTIKYPHSFVMGIFNYLSSLMHCAGQLLFRHLLRMSKLREEDKKLDFYGIAHSDDANGTIDCSSKYHLEKVLKEYEIFSKYLNHMQSNKKCIVDTESGEVIAIVRIDKKVVTMLAKFTAGLNFSPTYEGLVTENKNLVSKTIELISNGATFGQSYKTYRMMVHYLNYRIYLLNKANYSLPTELMGTPDVYSFLQMLYGTEVDNFLLMYKKYEDYMLMIDLLNDEQRPDFLGLSYVSRTRNLRVDFEKEMKSKLNEEMVEFLKSETLMQNRFNNDLINRFKVVAMMQNKHFAASTAGGHQNQGLSYLFRNNSKFSYSVRDDLMIPWKARQTISEIFERANRRTVNRPEVVADICNILSILDKIPVKIDEVRTSVVIKPCSFNYENSSLKLFKDINRIKATCYVKEKKYRNLINLSITERKKLDLLSDFIGSLGEVEVSRMIEYLCGEESYNFYFYASLPTEKRTIENVNEVLDLLSYNAKRGCKILSLAGRRLAVNLSDWENRTKIDAISVVNEMRGYLPNELRASFNQNYRMIINGEAYTLIDLANRFVRSPNIYDQVMHYQILYSLSMFKELDSFLSSEGCNLPLFYYAKRQQGVGNVWYGEGSLNFKTRTCDANVQLFNNRMKKLNLNKGASDIDIIYLFNELASIGFIHPCLYKETSDNTDDLCVGFDEISSTNPRIVRERDCKFKLCGVRFHEQEVVYPELKLIDSRKVKQLKPEKKFEIRLTEHYMGSSVELLLDDADNKKWMKENLKIETPWFSKTDVKFVMVERPTAYNAERLGFSYVFVSSIIPFEALPSLREKRIYTPGLSGGIIDCIKENHPEYLRVPEYHALWLKMYNNYPGSFLFDIEQARRTERGKIFNKYFSKLLAGDAAIDSGLKNYISETYSIVIHDPNLPREINTYVLLENFKNGNNLESVYFSLVNIVRNSSIHYRLNITVEELIKETLLNNNKFLIDAVFMEFFLTIRNKDPKALKEMNNELGLPWSLLMNRIEHIYYFWYNCARNSKEVFNSLLARLREQQRNRGASESVFERGISILLKKEGQTISELNDLHKQKLKELTCTRNFDANFGQIEKSIVLADKNKIRNYLDRVEEEILPIGYLSFEKEVNKGFVKDEEDGENIADDPSSRISNRVKGKLIKLGNAKGSTINSVECLKAAYGVNGQFYHLCCDELPELFWKPTNFSIHITDNCYLLCFGFGGTFKFTTNLMGCDYDTYRNFYNLCKLKLSSQGTIYVQGKSLVIEEDKLNKKIKADLDQALKGKTEMQQLVKLSNLGSFDLKSKINNIMEASEVKGPELVLKEYEPMGSFILHKPLEVFMSTAFPKTFRELLRGNIKITERDNNQLIKMYKDLQGSERQIFNRLMRSLNVLPLDKISHSDAYTGQQFLEEFDKFFTKDTDDLTQEYSEVYQLPDSQYVTDVSQSSIKLVIS